MHPADLIESIRARVNQTMYGMETVIDLCLVAFFTDGHILLEANPGLGKTSLIKALRDAMQLDQARIQFTPDLMPSDITGTQIPRFENGAIVGLETQPGPIFTTLLLADEINRATPKTQSALLEAMAERQVTISGATYRIVPRDNFDHYYRSRNNGQLPPSYPFMVLATQNPIDQEGTYTLPEAQSDRFMFKVLMPIPDSDILLRIMDKETGPPQQQRNTLAGMAQQDSDAPVFADEQHALDFYHQTRADIRHVEGLPLLQQHILNLYEVSNGNIPRNINSRRRLEAMIPAIRYGLGPRAASALMLGAKAHTYLFSRNQMADGIALGTVVLPVLRHRLKLDLWQYDSGDAATTDTSRRADHFIQNLCIACAPSDDKGYLASFQSTLTHLVETGAC